MELEAFVTLAAIRQEGTSNNNHLSNSAAHFNTQT
jgi:hypothetical protein